MICVLVLRPEATSRAGPLKGYLEMKELLNRAITGVRLWLGWTDLSETRMSPGHGWLLPTPSVVHDLHTGAQPAVAPADASGRTTRG